MRPDELSGLLQRASEISTETEEILSNDPELALIAHSAEEAGLPREAILAALRERLAQRGNLIKAGEIVLAESVDGIFYPAMVKETDGSMVKVRFLQGGDSFLPSHSIQPFSASPGAKFQFFTPAMGMWTTGHLTRFNEDSRTATFECWGSEYTVPLEKVRLSPQGKKGFLLQLGQRRILALLIGLAISITATLLLALMRR